LSPSRDEKSPEANFGATLRYMGLIFGAIVLAALALGWLLTR
jgi:hypothetical protein